MTKKPTTAQEEKSEGIVAKAKAFRNYLELSKTELRKVTWPTVKETRTTSLVVLAFVVVMAIFLGVVDLGLTKIIKKKKKRVVLKKIFFLRYNRRGLGPFRCNPSLPHYTANKPVKSGKKSCACTKIGGKL